MSDTTAEELTLDDLEDYDPTYDTNASPTGRQLCRQRRHNLSAVVSALFPESVLVDFAPDPPEGEGLGGVDRLRCDSLPLLDQEINPLE